MAAATVGMGISFKLSKVGVRVQPAARPGSAAPAQAAEAVQSGTAEKEGSVSESRREVRRASVVCSIGLFVIPPGEILRAALAGVGIWARKDWFFFCDETMKKLTFLWNWGVFRVEFRVLDES